jgi:hypothetical protein
MAIEHVITAYYDSDEAWLLSEYVVLTAQQRFDDNGDSVTAVGTILRDGDVPLHRALGLVDYVATRLRMHAVDDDPA